MSIPQPERAVICIYPTPGLTLGKHYVVRAEGIERQLYMGLMLNVLDDTVRVRNYWAWRFHPGPPVPPRSSFRFGG